tara:strand:- start:1078 stop:1725 length:648 start_codon:yes stop_codon:yes gene_type:complete
MKFPLLFLLISGIALTQQNCRQQVKVGILFGSSESMSASDYPKVLETWTRSSKIYDSLESKAFVTATFHSPEFRRAFAAAFPEIYGHGGNITRRELVDLTDNIEQYLNFFVSIYTANPKWNDLAKIDSIWQLSLTGERDIAVKPAAVIPVKLDANLRAVYPYIGRFDKAYLVRFPLTDPLNRLVVPTSSQGFGLRIASALGKTSLEWQLLPPEVL